jgi:hypothetical protein
MTVCRTPKDQNITPQQCPCNPLILHPLGIYSIPIDYYLLLPACTGRCDLRCRHQISDVFLEELVVIIELVVLFLHRFDAVEYLE